MTSKERREQFKRERDIRKCERKTLIGSVFQTQQYAHVIALIIENKSVNRIGEFQCGICGLWHIGSRGRKRG